MKNYKNIKNFQNYIIIANLLIFVCYFSYSILNKESILNNGNIVLLKLAPVDPRSLLQGDYMDLRDAIADTLWEENNKSKLNKKGYYVVELDSNKVAKYTKVLKDNEQVESNQFILPYHYSGYRFNLGAESFFFQEGKAKIYEKAEYGGLNVDKYGNTILYGLYDKNCKIIN